MTGRTISCRKKQKICKAKIDNNMTINKLKIKLNKRRKQVYRVALFSLDSRHSGGARPASQTGFPCGTLQMQKPITTASSNYYYAVNVNVSVNVEFKVTLHKQVRYRGTLQY